MKYRPYVSADAMLEGVRRQAVEVQNTMPEGVPSGGTTGQVLKKNSAADGDYSWADSASGGGLDLDYMRLSNTDTTTSVNTAAELPLATEAGTATNFTKSGNGIRTDFDGVIELSASAHMETAAVQRAGVALEYWKNGATLGPRYNTSYIRRASNHNEASCTCAPLIVDCADGDVFTLRTIQEAAGGAVTLSGAGRAYFQAKRLS